MKKLEITKGKWKIVRGTTSAVYADVYDNPVVCSFRAGYGQDFNNAQLIADAGNTYQECELLPSELLKQNKELREALQVTVTQLNNYAQVWGYDESKAVEKAEQVLNSKP